MSVPHDDCWVGYASWAGELHVFAGEQLIGTPDLGRPEEAYCAYSLVLTIERLVVKLFGLVNGPMPGYEMGHDTSVIRQFWPPRHVSLGWPLPWAGQEDNLGHLMDLAPMSKTTVTG